MKLQVLLLSLWVSSVCCSPNFLLGRRWDQYGLIGQLHDHVESNLLMSKRVADTDEFWINQRLDHFDPANTNTWKQRYFVNDQYFVPGGPVFLQLGGEGVADPIWLQKGQIAQNYGKKFNALLIYIEHRYYGKSHPTTDLSVQNMRYLTSQQALADFANFIEIYNQETPFLNDTKWITFGGSYSGSLSAWMRLKYPHLVEAAVASSAPLLAQLNFKDYVGVVVDSLGQECVGNIQAAVQQIEALIKKGEPGWTSLDRSFTICNQTDAFGATFRPTAPPTKDVNNFFQSLCGNFEGVVQYNKDNRMTETGKNITIDVVCAMMKEPLIGTELDRYAAVNNLLLKTYDQKCLDISWDKMIQDLKNTSWDSPAANGSRQWTYQTCTEFGFYQTSDLPNQPFGNYFNLTFFENMCTEVYDVRFGDKFEEDAIQFSNTLNGGLDIAGSRIIFPNGSIDPWHKLGITDQNQAPAESLAVYINGTAHCADMYPDAENDPEVLKKARETISAFLQKNLKRTHRKH